MKKFVVPPISPEEQTPLVRALMAMIGELVEEVQRQGEEIQQMRDEIAVLKGEKAKPKFKASKMDEETDKAKARKLILDFGALAHHVVPVFVHVQGRLLAARSP